MRTAHSSEGRPPSPPKGGEGSGHGPHQGARDDGASLVEFALVVPLFVFLLFAFIDFGLSFGGIVALRSEVNAGARLASVDQTDPACAGQQNPMLCTVENRIQGITGIAPGSVQVAIAFVLPAGATEAQAGDPVIVCAQATLQSTTGLTAPLLNGRTFYAASELRLEQSPSYSAGGTGTFGCSAP